MSQQQRRDETPGVSKPRQPAAELPDHVAVIMDGNGRWARRQSLVRFRGHEQGAKSLRRITRHCRSLSIRELTIYALSTENYARRPRREIRYLMGLLRDYLINERSELMDNDIRLVTIGDVESLPDEVVAEMRETKRLTAGNKSMVLRLALNYGARQEILRAVQGLLAQVKSGELTLLEVEELDELTFRRFFYDPQMSDPDLLIRTAGEYRLSNFLLWQCSYTELWTTEALWPDFDVADFDSALKSYVHRDRKYGAVSEELGAATES